MNIRHLALGSLLPLLAACDNPAPTADSSKAATSAHPMTASASAKPMASAAPTAPTASAMSTASAAPSAMTSASASATAAALVPSEAAAATAPTADDFKAETKEIAVSASGENKCTTKVLHGWFEILCVADDKLVRATKVEVLSGFTKDHTEADGGKTFRWVAALPSDGSISQARMYGAKMHEIWVTLNNTDKGWKGAFTASKP